MKKALCIGLNHYGIPNSDLRGCVNDVKNISGMLSDQFGFNDITILLDHQATTAAIKDHLEKLVIDSKPKAGDTIVISFSGHGSQTVDLDGDEIDGADEILCPYDLNWKQNMIVDDYLYKVLSEVDPEVQLVFLSDSCHSGSLLRVAQGHYLVPRYLNPPVEILEKIMDLKSAIYDNDAHMSTITVNGTKKENFNTRNGILLSGCQSNQTSADAYMDRKYQGAFTCVLTKILKQFNYDIAYGELIKKCNIMLDRLGYSQNPQLEAPDQWLNKKFLGQYHETN